MDILKLTALELGAKIRQREITPTQALNAVYTAAKNDKYNCYISLDIEPALELATEVEKRINSGEALSPLAGVPIAVKDNICTKGVRTTAGSKMLADFTPPYDATVVERLKAAGMIPLGKTNMDEFAMGATTETSAFGTVINPHSAECVAGGSSGGSAAAVAAKSAIVALGSDTGGSVRQPCSFCGVTGLKPTYGAVSRYGLIAYASSLDTIGAIGKDVCDVAAVFDVIRGGDSKDMTSRDIHYAEHSDIIGMRIGIPAEFIDGEISADVRSSILRAADELRNMGAEVETFSLSILKYAVPAYYIIACAEASSNLARYDGVKYGYRSKNADTLEELYINSRTDAFGAEVKKRIMLGNFVLSAGYFDDYYKKALKTKALICNAFDEAFKNYDFLLAPIAPDTAYKIGEGAKKPLKMYTGDIYTAAVNLAGLPALALPCGFGKNGMPIGMQFIGKAFDEQTILSAGMQYQAVYNYHRRGGACDE